MAIGYSKSLVCEVAQAAKGILTTSVLCSFSRNDSHPRPYFTGISSRQVQTTSCYGIRGRRGMFPFVWHMECFAKTVFSLPAP